MNYFDSSISEEIRGATPADLTVPVPNGFQVTVLVVDAPLRRSMRLNDWDSGSINPYRGGMKRSGLEDFTIEMVQNENPGFGVGSQMRIMGVMFDLASESWMKNVKVMTFGDSPLWISRSRHIEIRDCVFDRTWYPYVGSTGYVLLGSSHDSLYEGIVARYLRHAPDIQSGSTGKNSNF